MKKYIFETTNAIELKRLNEKVILKKKQPDQSKGVKDVGLAIKQIFTEEYDTAITNLKKTLNF